MLSISSNRTRLFFYFTINNRTIKRNSGELQIGALFYYANGE